MALFLIRTRRRRDADQGRAGRARAAGTRRRLTATPSPVSLVTPVANGTHHERPEPRLRWADDHDVPAGDYRASAIANAALSTDDVPVRGEPCEALAEFALSYDGYAYWDDLPELANRVLQRWTRDRSLPATLDELRGCLFYEQRRWHHFGEDPAGRSARYMWSIVEAIDALVAPRPSAVGSPHDPRPVRASETHVQLLPRPSVVEPVAADADTRRALPRPARPNGGAGLRPVPTHPVGLRVVSTRQGALRPVAGSPTVRTLVPAGGRVPAAPARAGAHVRLVSAIESGSAASTFVSGGAGRPDGADIPDSRRVDAAGAQAVTARHPSAWRSGRPSTGTRDDLRPMPSAEPLPKPPVIERRSHRAFDATAGSGVVRALPGRNGASPATAVRVFDHDDGGYLRWLAEHATGFVLNHARTGQGPAPTLHRVGCGALESGGRLSHTLTERSPKACAATADALAAWCRANGAGAPSPCGRCQP